nr:hypothetical protein [Tanacetum cinerariifolium]
MDDPNITMEEYIRLEEEKVQKRGKVFNWETTKYGKIWYDEDVLGLKSIEMEFPAIVCNDSLTSNETPSYEPTLENDVLPSSGYGVSDLVSLVVFGEHRHRYAVSSLMDTAYWLSE